MSQCSRCDGMGKETFWDDRWETDICYHCGGSGKVDDETAFVDSLSQVARTLAYHAVDQMRNCRNSHPDGEGWDFCAAENMMTGSEYFLTIMENYVSEYMDRLLEMDRQRQEVLIAWNALPVSVKPLMQSISIEPIYYTPEMESADQDDVIPF